MKYIYSIFIISILAMVPLISFAADPATSVKVNFTGSIKGSTCKIVTDNLNVNLGVWLIYGMSKNSTTEWEEFDLEFTCTSGSQIVGKLQGTQASDGRSFAIDQGDGAATGMAIQIEAYSTERRVWEAKRNNSVSVLLSSKATSNGANKVKFRANYKLLADAATAGNANASITFVVENN